MNVIMNRRAADRRADRPAPTPREATITKATVLITNLLRCVIWLVRHGIYVIGFAGKQSAHIDHVTVYVAASPILYRLFGDECAWQIRRQEGALTVYVWFAIRFGIRIQWEEVVCAH